MQFEGELVMGIVSLILQGLLGLGFLMFGLMKFGAKQMVDDFNRYGLSSGFRMLTGSLEIIGAALIIAGFWNSQLIGFGSLLMIVIMIGAIFTHLRIKDPASKTVMPIVLLAFGLVVLLYNWSDFLG